MTDQSQSRANHPSARRTCRCPQHCPSAIAQARLDVEVWAQTLWPWLTAVDIRCPNWGRAMARILLTTVRREPDGTLSVDIGRDYGMTAWTTTRAIARLCGVGLLGSLPPDDGGECRARIVLPE